MAVAPPQAGSEEGAVRISTRQLRDVALRALRARGVPYGPAGAAAAGVERMEVLTGSGLAALVALLARGADTPSFALIGECSGPTAVPAGGSGVLFAAPLGDVLAAAAPVPDMSSVHEPWLLAPALADHADRSGTALRLRWSAPSAAGSCLATGGPGGGPSLTGSTAPGSGPWSCRLEAVSIRPAAGDRAPVGSAAADRMGRARCEGLVVDAADWAEAVAVARGFLVADAP